MKSINFGSTVTTLLLLSSIIVCSFAPVPGGYSYEVYLNNQLVIKEHLYGRTEVPSVALSMTTAQDELSIMFNNCNKVDTSRKISLKDQDDKTLKEWTFADSPDLKNRMKIKVTEIVAFRNDHSTAKLVYSSNEVQSGVQMINIQLSDAAAKRK